MTTKMAWLAGRIGTLGGIQSRGQAFIQGGMRVHEVLRIPVSGVMQHQQLGSRDQMRDIVPHGGHAHQLAVVPLRRAL